MRITRKLLREMIKDEVRNVLNEAPFGGEPVWDPGIGDDEWPGYTAGDDPDVLAHLGASSVNDVDYISTEDDTGKYDRIIGRVT